jgi:hypothetical protein
MKQLAIETYKSVREISEAMRNAQLCGTCRTAFAVERGTCRECLDGFEPAPLEYSEVSRTAPLPSRAPKIRRARLFSRG